MRSLILWDNPSDAELIALYLNVDGDEAVVTTDCDEFLAEAVSGKEWHVVLLPTSSPDHLAAYETFQQVRRMLLDVPIVGACQLEDLYRLAGFLTNGLRSYVIRDAAGDFMFLLKATLDSVVEAVRAERERMISEMLREEVESVRKLQKSIIPRDLAAPAGYRICGRYESSQLRVLGGRPVVLAGGDYYDVFRLDDETTVVLMGDAAGHGMKACMAIIMMHTLVTMLRSHEYRQPGAFMAEVNRRLCGQRIVQEDGSFITLLYGILRSDTHEFQWASAGHPFPILQEFKTNGIGTLGNRTDGGLPLGILPDAEYDVHTFPVPAGSRLLVYTDGLHEAFPEQTDGHREYGLDGIERTLRASENVPLESALQALFDDSSAFTEGSGRHDDTSVVLIERLNHAADL